MQFPVNWNDLPGTVAWALPRVQALVTCLEKELTYEGRTWVVPADATLGLSMAQLSDDKVSSIRELTPAGMTQTLQRISNQHDR